MKQSQDRLCRYSNIMYEVVGMYRLIKKVPLRKKREFESERGDLTRLFFHDVSILFYQFTFQHCALISQYNHNIIFLYPFINALTQTLFPAKKRSFRLAVLSVTSVSSRSIVDHAFFFLVLLDKIEKYAIF